MRGIHCGLLIVSTLALGNVSVAGETAEPLSAAALRHHVEVLASDEMLGREAGYPAIVGAEEYVDRQFAELGLKPLPGHDRFFVEIDLYRAGYDLGETAVEARAGEALGSAEAGVDFRPFDFSDEGRVDAEVVFAGYGITAPEHEYDDYAGLDVTGKIVLVLRHEPNETDPASSFDGAEHTRYARFQAKASRARELGARGMMLVTDPLNHAAADDLRIGRRLSLDPPKDEREGEPRPDEERLIAVQVSQAFVRSWLEPVGVDLAELQRSLDEGRPAAELDFPEVRATLRVRRDPDAIRVPARNVVALLPGGDPELQDEWILIGGHHDHVGGFHGEGDTVYNGADDNASGTSGVLELARAFATREDRPPRTIAFATFTAEEKGLLGSRALVEQGLLPVDKIRFMVNLDMIGRNPDRPIEVIGDGYARGLRTRIDELNRGEGGPGLALDFAGFDYAGNSDHHAFYQASIPFLFLFTGVHEDYHQRGDHVTKLDFDRMQRITRLAYRLVDELSATAAMPSFVHRPNWLGVQIEEGDLVAAVDADSRAMAAGLTPGDRILRVDGEPPVGRGGAGARLREVDPGSSVQVEVVGDGEPRTITLARAHTGYLGIGPAAVDPDRRAELGLPDGEGVQVRSVLPDGPSERAGLRQGDIILRIAGRPVDSGGLSAVLSQIGAGEEVDLTFLRDGERQTVKLTLGERPRRR